MVKSRTIDWGANDDTGKNYLDNLKPDNKDYESAQRTNPLQWHQEPLCRTFSQKEVISLERLLIGKKDNHLLNSSTGKH